MILRPGTSVAGGVTGEPNFDGAIAFAACSASTSPKPYAGSCPAVPRSWAVMVMASFTSAGDAVGAALQTSAATPTACGHAIDVPLSVSYSSATLTAVSVEFAAALRSVSPSAYAMPTVTGHGNVRSAGRSTPEESFPISVQLPYESFVQ